MVLEFFKWLKQSTEQTPTLLCYFNRNVALTSCLVMNFFSRQCDVNYGAPCTLESTTMCLAFLSSTSTLMALTTSVMFDVHGSSEKKNRRGQRHLGMRSWSSKCIAFIHPFNPTTSMLLIPCSPSAYSIIAVGWGKSFLFRIC